MSLVLLACIPGLLTLLWLHGWGLLLNLLLCAIAAILCETLLLAMRGQTLKPALGDCSALVTAVLLACALPPLAPWWLPVVATSVAIGIGKQAFGGVGRNLFNPAMVGYAFVSRYVDAWHVMNVAVAPEHRRRGIARGLLEHLFDVTSTGDLLSADDYAVLVAG